MALISLCFKQEPFFSALCIIYMPAPRENAFASIRLGFFCRQRKNPLWLRAVTVKKAGQIEEVFFKTARNQKEEDSQLGILSVARSSPCRIN